MNLQSKAICAVRPFLVMIALWAEAVFVEAGDAPRFPREIRLTDEDCASINQKGLLRGRRVWRQVGESGGLWAGLRVFTGEKSDALGWFSSASHRELHLVGFQGVLLGRGVQYALLCGELLRSGDKDVLLAVLWNSRNDGEMGYLADDWEALFHDERLSVADRLVAWSRWTHCVAADYLHETRETRDEVRARIALCWRTLGPKLSPRDIVHAYVDAPSARMRLYDWIMAEDLTQDTAERLLLPIVRREYLGEPEDAQAHIVNTVVHSLRRFAPARAEIVRRLMSFDQEWDERSVGVWDSSMVGGLPEKLGEESAKELRSFAPAAKLSQVAGRAFWAYLRTPAGREELKKDGGKAFLQGYLRAAFGKESEDRQVGYLCALAATEEGRAGLLRTFEWWEVRLAVTEAQFELLKRAWSKVPKALHYLIVVDKKK